MRAFRRSTKSLGGSNEAKHHISIPQKDATAIVPPKLVIKAKYDYHPSGADPRYLGFSQGDFLHVVGRENDPDWYEACNPIVNTRGLVPVNYFELIPKARNSGDRTGSEINGHQMNLVDRSVGASRTGSIQAGPAASLPDSRSSTMGRSSGAMVYGIVLYDFKAERPDELQASAGEAIIVIAQSNPEWFVAKPITRLGGPGLIPVSFIEIRDMTTGQAVPDTQAAVQRAGVPRVEEWKRMAASYKNSSIPLGRLGSSQQGSHDSSNETRRPSQQYNERWSGQRASGAPLRARVPRFCHHEMKFWFVVEAYLDDGRSWELNREYTDFYTLQTTLMEQFPEASGKTGPKRILPFMPGPLPWVTERLTSERREHMDKYLLQLLQMGTNHGDLGRHILASRAVRDFFQPREGDSEVDGFAETDSEWVRLSQGSSQQSYHAHDSRQSSTGNLNGGGGGAAGGNNGYMSPPASRQTGGAGHYRSPSNETRSPPANYQQQQYGQQHSSSGGGGGKIKVKAFMGEHNTVILRMDEGFDFRQLLEKVRERWRLDNPGSGREADQLIMDYKDARTGDFYPLLSDGDLRRAYETGEKLTVRVGVDGAAGY